MKLYIVEVSDGTDSEQMLIKAPSLLEAESIGKRSSGLDYATISTTLYTEKHAEALGLTNYDEISEQEVSNGDLVEVKSHPYDSWSKLPYRYIGMRRGDQSDQYVVESTRTGLFYAYDYCRRLK